MSSVYESCSAESGGNLELVVECVANWVESSRNGGNGGNGTTDGSSSPTATATKTYVDTDELKSWLLVLTGALVFFMQAGFAMVCAGAIRKKNVNNAMLKNLLDACGAGLAFYALGYGFAYGLNVNEEGEASGSTFIGHRHFLLIGDADPAKFFFQYAFCATAVTIVAGALAERCKMASYFCYSIFLSGFVYPVVVHCFWSKQGYLSPTNPNTIVGVGAVDFSGSGVIHITGGTTALYAAYILGARRGRFTDRNGKPLSKPGLIKGHSPSLQMLGTMILWFCWYGFNSGSALLLDTDQRGGVAARAAVNTTLGGASATICALFFRAFIIERRTGEFILDMSMAMNGCLAGLVAITAGCGVVEHWASVLIGLIGGMVYVGADALLIACKIDDAVSAIPVHLANGIWGMVAVGLFAKPEHLKAAYRMDTHPGLCYMNGRGSSLLPAQLIGIIFIVVWTFVTMMPFFVALDYLGWFRVNELEELVGLDVSYLDSAHEEEDDDSNNNEDLRLAAYRQRLAERRQLRDKTPIQPMTVGGLLHDSCYGLKPEPPSSMDDEPHQPAARLEMEQSNSNPSNSNKNTTSNESEAAVAAAAAAAITGPKLPKLTLRERAEKLALERESEREKYDLA